MWYVLNEFRSSNSLNGKVIILIFDIRLSTWFLFLITITFRISRVELDVSSMSSLCSRTSAIKIFFDKEHQEKSKFLVSNCESTLHETY